MEMDSPGGASDPQSGLEEREKVRRRYFAQYPQATVSTKSPDFSLKTGERPLYATNGSGERSRIAADRCRDQHSKGRVPETKCMEAFLATEPE
jgi:hypothetical protein